MSQYSKEVKAFLAETGMSQSEFARAAGISQASISKFIRGGKMRQSHLAKIGAAMRQVRETGLGMAEAPACQVVIPIVHPEGDRLYVTSREIAEAFGKRHADVIRDIENLECSQEFRERNFALSIYVDSQGKEQKEYRVFEDGAMRLIMGFNGPRAAIVKEAYLAEFRRRGEELKAVKGQLAQVSQDAGLVSAQLMLKIMAMADDLHKKINQGLERTETQVALLTEKVAAVVEVSAEVDGHLEDHDERLEVESRISQDSGLTVTQVGELEETANLRAREIGSWHVRGFIFRMLKRKYLPGISANACRFHMIRQRDFEQARQDARAYNPDQQEQRQLAQVWSTDKGRMEKEAMQIAYRELVAKKAPTVLPLERTNQ